MAASLVYQEGDGETAMPGSTETFPKHFADTVAKRSGNLVSATADDVTLEAAASSRNGDYVGNLFLTGSQVVTITAYRGDTRKATVSPAFSPTPTASDAYSMVSARRVAVQNIGDVPITFDFDFLPAGQTDGSAFFRAALDPDTLSPPYNVAAVLGAAGAGGVWGATGSYDWRVIATKTGGKVTTGSVLVTVTVDVTTKKVTLTWSKIFGTGYQVYRKLSSGSWGATDLVFTTADPDVLTFVDDGTAAGAGALPVVNTTGASATSPFGPAPTLAAGPLDMGTLNPGEQKMLWLDWLISSGVPTTLLGVGLTVNER